MNLLDVPTCIPTDLAQLPTIDARLDGCKYHQTRGVSNICFLDWFLYFLGLLVLALNTSYCYCGLYPVRPYALICGCRLGCRRLAKMPHSRRLDAT